jgi:hypothetical protein
MLVYVVQEGCLLGSHIVGVLMRVPQPQRMVEVEIDKISAKVILRNRVQLTEMPLARFRKDQVV